MFHWEKRAIGDEFNLDESFYKASHWFKIDEQQIIKQLEQNVYSNIDCSQLPFQSDMNSPNDQNRDRERHRMW